MNPGTRGCSEPRSWPCTPAEAPAADSVSKKKKQSKTKQGGNGRVYGYDGGVDLDKFYGDEETWMKYADPNCATYSPFECKYVI